LYLLKWLCPRWIAALPAGGETAFADKFQQALPLRIALIPRLGATAIGCYSSGSITADVLTTLSIGALLLISASMTTPAPSNQLTGF